MVKDLVGFLLPPLIDVVNVKVKDEKIRFLVSLVICVVVGAILNVDRLAAGSVEEALRSAGIVFATAQTAYRLYWKKSEVRENLRVRFK